jgi:hypothetical protein
MKSKQRRDRMSYWQLIFSQSKVNGASYKEHDLPSYNWNWPTDTYFQRRRSLKESLTEFCPAGSPLSEHDEWQRFSAAAESVGETDDAVARERVKYISLRGLIKSYAEPDD